MLESVCSQILNSPARKMKMLFSCLAGHLIINITGRSTEYSMKHVGKWLRDEVPHQPKCGEYFWRAIGVSNSIDIPNYANNHRR